MGFHAVRWVQRRRTRSAFAAAGASKHAACMRRSQDANVSLITAAKCVIKSEFNTLRPLAHSYTYTRCNDVVMTKCSVERVQIHDYVLASHREGSLQYRESPNGSRRKVSCSNRNVIWRHTEPKSLAFFRACCTGSC